MWIYAILGYVAFLAFFLWGWSRFWDRVEPLDGE
jgi:hypothetical protein